MTYTFYPAAALLVINFQEDEEDIHVVQYTGTEPSQKFKWVQNNNLLLGSNQYVAENFVLTPE